MQENGSQKKGKILATRNEEDFDKEELVRLIVQSLKHLGYEGSANFVQQESGILLQKTDVTEFCKCLLDGNWNQINSLLPSLNIERGEDQLAVRFHIFSQKYLELLEDKKVKEALHCLRSELTPLGQQQDRLHRLTSLIMCTDASDLKKKANWDGKFGESRKQVLNEIRKYVSPDTIIPEHRLAELVKQSIKYQIHNCLYHNAPQSQLTLFQDHECDKNQVPRETRYVLDQHSDEVWFVVFSHDGLRLASGSRDNTVIIWDVRSAFQNPRALLGHTGPISHLSWSPNDKHLLSCSNDNTVRLWNTEDGNCLRLFKHHTDMPNATAWFPDGERFVSGGNDKNLFICHIDGRLIRQWSAARVNDLTVTKDGKTIIIVCMEKKIRLYSVEDKSEQVIQENDSITSLGISNDSRHLLVNISLASGKITEIHLWDLLNRRLLQKYRGQIQKRYVIRSCFGGFNETFILSGAEENGQVHVWHRDQGVLLEVLSGHKGPVNSVSWNPTNPFMFASASDDHTVRVWMTPEPTQNGV